MAWQWLYEGALDADGRTLRLSTEGPGMDGAMARFRETITQQDGTTREMVSHALPDMGEPIEVMRARYRRSA